MKKKNKKIKNKKVKKNFKNKVLIFIIVLLLVITLIYYLQNINVKNIYITWNNYLTDQEIIELASLENYPKIFKISTSKIEKIIKLNPIVKSVKVTKNIFGKVQINIVENEYLLKQEIDNIIYLSNFETIINDNNIIGIPTLTNYVEIDILNDFLKKLVNIDKNVLCKISEITYKPNEYDKDLFLFLMNDGNYVYITTSKLESINKYNNILIELNGKKGILYLDSGNHFEILE